MIPLSYNHTVPVMAGKNPPILFIHGMDSSKETWTAVMNSLKDKYEIYAIDLRGHGETPLGDEEYTLDQLAEDVHQFAMEHKLNQFVLVGHSMGSRVCIAYASKHPGKVKAIAIEDMDLLPREKRDLTAGEVEKLKQFKQVHATELEARQELEQYNHKFDSWKAQGRIRIKSDHLWHIAFNPYTSYLAHNACQANEKAAHMFQQLRNDNLPILLMVAEHDSSTSETGISQMQEMVPGMKVVAIPQSEHAIHKTNINGFLGELSSFLQ